MIDIEKNTIINGNSLEVLKSLPDNSIDCCVTSPPYYALRDYGCDGQIGLEETPEKYIERLTEVFMEVYRVLKPNGTLWLNIGDSYNGSGGNHKEGQKNDTGFQGALGVRCGGEGARVKGLKPKDLIGIPWMLAFALRSQGWYLRQDIIWHKPNPMPESVTDRCTKSHEYIFLLSKSQRYYFDHEAIQEEATGYDGRKDTMMKGSKKYDTQICLIRAFSQWQRTDTKGGNSNQRIANTTDNGQTHCTWKGRQEYQTRYILLETSVTFGK